MSWKLTQVSPYPVLSESEQIPNDTKPSMWVFKSLSLFLSLFRSLQLNTKSGPNPGPGGRVTGSILHPAGGLSLADISEAEQVGVWRTQPGEVSSTKQCSQCSGLHLSFWSPLAHQLSLEWDQSEVGMGCEGLSAPVRVHQTGDFLWKLILTFPPQTHGAFVLCRQCQ